MWCARAELHQSGLILFNPPDCNLPDSSVQGILEYWTGLPRPPPGDLSDPGITPASLTSPALAVPPGKPG